MATKLADFGARQCVRTREEWRKLFFDEIDRNAELFEREVATGDHLRRLSPELIEMLASSPLRLLKYPAEVGGAEADNALQFEVYERLAYHNAAASWCLFIWTDFIGRVAALLPPAGFDVVFGDDIPLVSGGGGMVLGDLTPVEGGYRVSGRWAWGSGIDGARWLAVIGAEKGRAGPPEIISLVIPRDQVEVFDDWNVLGMRGSGSASFAVNNVFVPEKLSFPVSHGRERGGAIFALGMIGYISHTVPATALGLARRALDEVAGNATAKMRGYGRKISVAQRSVFQAYVAESDLKLRSCRAMMLENGRRLIEDVEKRGVANPALETEVRAAGYYATKLALGIVSEAVRFSGGEGIRLGGRIEQLLRDIHVISTHYAVNEIALESYGQSILGIEGADPMA